MENTNIDELLNKQMRKTLKYLHHNKSGFNGQNRIIHILVKQENHRISQRELVNMLENKAASVSEIVSKLIDKNYVKCLKDENDKRKIIIELTADGIKEYERIKHDRDEFFSCLNNEEKNELSTILSKLLEGWCRSENGTV